MAKFTVMSELQIYISLLFMMSFSATILGYAIYLEYKHSQHVNYIKDVISLQDDEMQSLLQEKEKPKSDKSFISRLDSIMIRAVLIFQLMFLFLFLYSFFLSLVLFLLSF